jgi:dual-specificity kinase
VYKAQDVLTKRFYAVKITGSESSRRLAARNEIRVLLTLATKGKDNENHCVHACDWFDVGRQICIVTPLYGPSIATFPVSGSQRPFPDRHMHEFAMQLFKSVAYVHSIGLIHTDIKPENILLEEKKLRTVSYTSMRASSSSMKPPVGHHKVLVNTFGQL